MNSEMIPNTILADFISNKSTPIPFSAAVERLSLSETRHTMKPIIGQIFLNVGIST